MKYCLLNSKYVVRDKPMLDLKNSQSSQSSQSSYTIRRLERIKFTGFCIFFLWMECYGLKRSDTKREETLLQQTATFHSKEKHQKTIYIIEWKKI